MKLLSAYGPGFAVAIVYMLQAVEYQPGPYFKWLQRVSNFRKVMYRRQLERTGPAKLLLLAVRLGLTLQYGVGLVLLILTNGPWQVVGAAAVLTAPWVWAMLVAVPLELGRRLIIVPKERKRVAASRELFANHPATVIAVAGSYGKTSMKELLATVLSVGKKVAITPANKNVAISHARFVEKLEGDEEILVIEYGEGKPGDVRRFAETTQPDIGIITGLAPAHLDQYASLDDAARDIFALQDYLSGKPVYVNGDSSSVEHYFRDNTVPYTRNGIAGWKVSHIVVDFEGTSFVFSKGSKKIALQSKLIGEHHIGPLALAAYLALELGLSEQQVVTGIAATKPYEHRMQPKYRDGVWIIDDTYNGTIEGMKAGLRLLKQLPGKRKLYVTPGLVDQGAESRAVHLELGKAIAASAPDVVVLMRNSVTETIQSGLTAGGFVGHLQIEDDPLAFYTSIDQVTAAGDVVLMQNDWTDNYA